MLRVQSQITCFVSLYVSKLSAKRLDSKQTRYLHVFFYLRGYMILESRKKTNLLLSKVVITQTDRQIGFLNDV